MTESVCPICRKEFDLALSAAKPFCSERCRKIDLGRWFGESYGVPWEPDEDELLSEEHLTDSDSYN